MQDFFADSFDRFREMHKVFTAVLEALPQEALDWAPGAGMNSLAVLAVHIAGAERYWIGDVVMGEPSGRVRDEEFRAANLDGEALSTRLESSLAFLEAAFSRLGLEDLGRIRVSPRDGREFSVGWAIQHALSHTALHTGHAELTRQLWEMRET